MPLNMYKRSFDMSRYPETWRRKNILTPKEFYRQENSAHFLDYDKNTSFFDTYKKLLENTPMLSRLVGQDMENCDYAESASNSKNVYLSYTVIKNCENIIYTFYAQDGVSDVVNGVMVWDKSQYIYFASGILHSFKVFYSKYIVNSNNIWFCTNLIGCSECIFCDNLENKKYCIKNIEYSKEEYLKKKWEILEKKLEFSQYYLQLNKTANNIASTNVTGQFCVESDNIENGYFSYRLHSGRNVIFVGHWDGRRDVYDTFWNDGDGIWSVYGGTNSWGYEHQYLCDAVLWSHLYYCFNCIECSYCLGCNSLLNKSYCIFNKQYSKEEWYEKVDEIFSDMEEQWILWNSLPWELNPFYFNDTVAWLLWDFTQEEVEAKWYLWRDEESKTDIPEWSEVIQVSELEDYQWFSQDWEWKINPEILKKVIVDEKWNYYRIVQMEYDFLMKHGLPLPEIHWMDRMKLNFWM